MKIKKYYIDIVEGRVSGFLPYILKLFLGILSFFYLIIINFKNRLYDSGTVRRRVFRSIKVISIGNLTWGGTGKTSMAMYICKKFHPNKTAVLTRGYGRDEVELLRNNLENEQINVLEGKNRIALLANICNEYDIAVLDDGFQYRKLKRDLDIILVNGKRPFGNGSVIPKGNLREPKSSLKRADLITVMYPEEGSGLEAEIKKLNPDAEIFKAEYVSKGLFGLDGRQVDNLAKIKSECACFAAIGFPEGFLDSLKKININPALKFIYPDHYDLKKPEFEKIEDECIEKGITDLVITEKDKTRFKFSARLNIYILKVELAVRNPDRFLTIINDVLAD